MGQILKEEIIPILHKILHTIEEEKFPKSFFYPDAISKLDITRKGKNKKTYRPKLPINKINQKQHGTKTMLHGLPW